MKEKIRKILKKHSIKEYVKSPYDSEVYLTNYVIYDRYFNNVIEDISKLFNCKQKPRISVGWECPKCGRVNAIWVKNCACYEKPVLKTQEEYTISK